jgi:hypothetical protein
LLHQIKQLAEIVVRFECTDLAQPMTPCSDQPNLTYCYAQVTEALLHE